MSPADLDLARQRLHDRRRALLARYHRTLDLVDEELDSREIEDVDTSSEQWDAQVLTALSVADRRHAEAIGAALERVAAGSYGRCVRCGAEEDLQFDHVIPVARGGGNAPENIQVLCGPCNRAKNSPSPPNSMLLMPPACMMS